MCVCVCVCVCVQHLETEVPVASFPHLPKAPVFDHLQYANTEGLPGNDSYGFAVSETMEGIRKWFLNCFYFVVTCKHWRQAGEAWE